MSIQHHPSERLAIDAYRLNKLGSCLLRYVREGGLSQWPYESLVEWFFNLHSDVKMPDDSPCNLARMYLHADILRRFTENEVKIHAKLSEEYNAIYYENSFIPPSYRHDLSAILNNLRLKHLAKFDFHGDLNELIVLNPRRLKIVMRNSEKCEIIVIDGFPALPLPGCACGCDSKHVYLVWKEPKVSVPWCLSCQEYI